MNHSENLNELAAALSVAQGKMKPAKMNAVNPFLKNRYADLGAVMDACRDVLADNGLSFVQMAFTPPLETFGRAVGVETMLMHKSGQWLSEQFVLPVGEERGKSIMQVAGSAISYARRYALAAMLGIVADEDTDGNGEQQKPPKTKVQKPADAPPAAATFTVGQSVTVKGKHDEKPGTVASDTGNGKVTVKVDGKQFDIDRDRVTARLEQTAILLDGTAHTVTGYEE